MPEVAGPSGLEVAGSWLRAHTCRDPWTSVIGLTRSLLALGMAGTLLSTPATVLFSPVPGLPHGATCGGGLSMTAFCLGGSTHRQGLAVLWGVVCLLIATGWRPRFTAPLQWWIAVSFFASSTIADGGDQVAVVLTLFLLPIALTDRRTWHWSRSGRGDEALGAAKLFAGWGLFLLRAQMAVIYLDAAISKFGVPQWANGTSMYYWLANPVFGVRPSLLGFEQRLLGLSVVVVAFTFGVVALELSLGLAFLFPPKVKRVLFWLAVSLHVGIAVLMGLVSFGFAMIAGLVVYLWPVDQVPGLVQPLVDLSERGARRTWVPATPPPSTPEGASAPDPERQPSDA